MAVDQDNNVWLVSDERKLLYWDRGQDIWIDRLPGNVETIKGLEILPDGTVWIALPVLDKVLGFDPKTGSWEYWPKPTDTAEQLCSEPRHALGLADKPY